MSKTLMAPGNETTSSPEFLRRSLRPAVIAMALLLPVAGAAEPIQLKLSFLGSTQGDIYRAGIKPFVDAVNTAGQGLVAIEVYPEAVLGPVAEQPRLVLDGKADIAWVVPGQTPYRFPDNELFELPGLFRTAREGTLVYTRLIATGTLRGYEDFFAIGAYTTGPTIIHSRKPIGSLAALAGQRIRANNAMEAAALERLGATPTVMPINRTAGAVGSGALDGAALTPNALFDFGVWAPAKNHYLLDGGVVPLVLLMNRRKFDSLPEAAKALIRQHSGEWAAATWIELVERGASYFLNRIKTDPTRKVNEPSPSDLETAQRVYQSMIDGWAAQSAHNRELLALVRAEIAKLRTRN